MQTAADIPDDETIQKANIIKLFKLCKQMHIEVNKTDKADELREKLKEKKEKLQLNMQTAADIPDDETIQKANMIQLFKLCKQMHIEVNKTDKADELREKLKEKKEKLQLNMQTAADIPDDETIQKANMIQLFKLCKQMHIEVNKTDKADELREKLRQKKEKLQLNMQTAADIPDDETIQKANMIQLFKLCKQMHIEVNKTDKADELREKLRQKKEKLQLNMQTAADIPDDETIQKANMIQLFKLCKQMHIEVNKTDKADELREKLKEKKEKLQLNMQTAADIPDDETIQKANIIKLFKLCKQMHIEVNKTDKADELREKLRQKKEKLQLNMQTAADIPDDETIQKANIIKLFKLCKQMHIEVNKTDKADELREKLRQKKEKLQLNMQTAADIPDDETIQKANMIQLFKLCKQMHIEVNKTDKADELREKLKQKKEKLQKKEQWLDETTTRLQKDKKTVKEIYVKLQMLLESKACEPWIKPEVDRRHGGNVIQEMMKKIEELEQKECPIVVTGETSAGKSSFLNMLFGFDILPNSVMHCTNTICRIKNSPDKRLEVTDFDGKTTTEARNVSNEEFKTTIKKYTTVDAEKTQQNIKYVDIYWPVPFLKDSITIVDTPGVSDNSELTKRLFDFLPEALAFIYILNTPNDGGVQTDRLGKILKEQQDRTKRGDDTNIDSSTTMFICNKWDQIAEEESDDVYNSVVSKLSSNWPNFRDGQLYKLSVKNVSQSKGKTYDLSKFQDSLMTFLKSSLTQMLIVHMRWCRKLVEEILHINNSDQHTSGMEEASRKGFIRQHMVKLERVKIEAIKIRQDFQSRLEEIQEDLAKHLHKHIQDDTVKHKILRAVEENCRNFDEGNPGREMRKIICRKIREELTFFCNIQQCFGKVHNEVVFHLDEIQHMFDRANRKLSGLPDILEWFFVQMMKLRSDLLTMSMWSHRKALDSLSALKIVFVMTGTSSILKKASEVVNSDDYKGNRKDFIIESTWKVIDKLTEGEMTNFLKELYFKDIERSFNLAYDDMIRRQVVHEITYLSILGAKSTGAILYDHWEIQSKCQEILKSIYQYLLKQVSEAIIPYEEVKSTKIILTDHFSTIHKIEERLQNARALKEIHVSDPFGHLEMYEKLRCLGHENIICIYGFTIKDDQESGINICVVMQWCDTPLTREWEAEKPCSKLDPKSEEFKKSLCTYLKFSIQIYEGLAYLHSNGLAHRNLKLENIMIEENETDTIKIAFYEELQITDDPATSSKDIIYVAPEILSRDMEKIVFKADDVYSLAMILWEMWYHERAFDSIASESNICKFLKEGGRPTFPSQDSLMLVEIKESIEKSWDQNPLKRPSCKETAGKMSKFLRESQSQITF